MLADVDADGKADVVGFTHNGVSVALSTGASFTQSSEWLAEFGYLAGGWRVERHPRVMADVNGDRRADIVGFADDGVHVSYSTGASFTPATRWLSEFGYQAGGWRVEEHPRFVVDVTGDGRADIVGFADEGVYVSLSTGYSFTPPQHVLTHFGRSAIAGTYTVGAHPRLLADVNGDGRADIVGFAHVGTVVSLALGNGQFTEARIWLVEFGSSAGWAVHAHPRFVLDMNSDGRADVVGFADDGVYVALSTGTSFARSQKWGAGADSGYSTGWRAEHPRVLADCDGDGDPDVVGFGAAATYTATNVGNALRPMLPWTSEFDENSGWRINRHPRMVVDVTGDGTAEIVGFAEHGVLVQSPPTSRRYGTSCFGDLNAYISLASVADERGLFLSHHGTERTFGVFTVGASATDLPLFQCRLLTMPVISLPAIAVGDTGSELQLIVPAVRDPVYLQYVGMAAGGRLRASNGLEIRH
jgi:hypothetical protein